MINQRKTVWVTKYSLYPGKDCAFTKEEAIAIAEKMRAKKIASLRKQIEKLAGMKFG